MSPDLGIGYRMSRSDLSNLVVEYLSDTVTCADKTRLWKAIDFRRKFAQDCERKPEHIGMIKTILFSYLSGGQEQYILASTLPERNVDRNELRIELGLTADETRSLTHKLDDVIIKTITGRERGTVSPHLDQENAAKIKAIYFTRDLMIDASSSPEKIYDVPLTLTVSEFWNAVPLFTFLQQRSSNYKQAGDFERECEVVDLRAKKIDQKKAGYNLLFHGTIVRYRGKEYQITNPPMLKEEVDRKRKGLLCTAFPIHRGEGGRVQYEIDEERQIMKKQLFLPITYELLEKISQP